MLDLTVPAKTVIFMLIEKCTISISMIVSLSM